MHNTVADSISRLTYNPNVNKTSENYYIQRSTNKIDQVYWKTFTKCWCDYERSHLKSNYANNEATMNFVFANRSEETDIYPLTTPEIAEAQQLDKSFKREDSYKLCLVGNVPVLCKDNKVVIPKSLQYRAVMWYHHYLQHPGHTRLEETLRAAMYWKGMRNTIRSYVKTCRSCQINKRRALKFGHLPTKFVIKNPWEALCVDLIGPYTLKGKDKSVIDFMCLTMIDPASSWFEIVELPVVKVTTPKIKGKNGTKTPILTTKESEEKFDKSSNQISILVYKTWLSRYPRCQYIIYDNGSEFKLHFAALCDSFGIKRKPTNVKNPQANAILERVHQVLMTMLRTAELDMATSVAPEDRHLPIRCSMGYSLYIPYST